MFRWNLTNYPILSEQTERQLENEHTPGCVQRELEWNANRLSRLAIHRPTIAPCRCKRIPKKGDHEGSEVPLRRHRRANNNRSRTTLQQGPTRFISRREDGTRQKERARDDRLRYPRRRNVPLWDSELIALSPPRGTVFRVSTPSPRLGPSILDFNAYITTSSKFRSRSCTMDKDG